MVELSVSMSSLKKLLLISLLLVVFLVEISLTLNSPIAFGDEGFHVSTARYIGTNLDYSATVPLLGSELYPVNYARPPLWNLMEGSFYFLFGGFNETFVKILIPFISFMTGLSIFVFVRRLYSENAGIIAAIITVTIPSFVTYSVLFYTTVPFVFFFTLGLLSFLSALKTNNRKYWIIAGLFTGLALLINIAALFLVLLVVLMGVFQIVRKRNLKNLRNVIKTYGPLLILISLIAMPLFVRNSVLFGVEGCYNPLSLFQGTCAEGVSYDVVTDKEFEGVAANVGTEQSILGIGVPGYLQFAYGFGSENFYLNLIGVAFIPFLFLAGLLFVMKTKKMHDIALVLIAVIFFIGFFQVGGVFEGRAEDSARYFLSTVPLAGILAAVYISNIRKDGNKFNTLLVVAIISVIVLVSFFSFFSKTSQLHSVKAFAPSFFEACNWVEENTLEDSILLSLHTYPTIFNCNRQAIWATPDSSDIVLSGDPNLATDRLNANGIDYVFVQKFSLSNSLLLQSYPISFVNMLDSNNQTFTKVYENGPVFGTDALNICIGSGGCDSGTIIYQVSSS